MVSREEYLKALEIVKAYQKQCEGDIKEIERVVNHDAGNEILKNTLLVESNISVRLFNVLNFYNSQLGLPSLSPDIDGARVKNLANVSEKQLLRCRNMGKMLMKEIKDLCAKAGITMKP